ncbi:MAG: hypothetical protein RSG52_03500 [Terrisporobacter sp.]|uniref:hypothetical protein n=1 Tax=Terrisporobacter sp. TaxID=1965305 RepID=UPI002FCC0DC3
MNFLYIKIFIDELQLCIIDYRENERRKIKNEEVIFPVSFNIGDRLNYIKKIVSVIIEQYNVVGYKLEIDDDIGVEIIEAVKMEGVLEELFSCKGVEIWK